MNSNIYRFLYNILKFIILVIILIHWFYWVSSATAKITDELFLWQNKLFEINCRWRYKKVIEWDKTISVPLRCSILLQIHVKIWKWNYDWRLFVYKYFNMVKNSITFKNSITYIFRFLRISQREIENISHSVSTLIKLSKIWGEMLKKVYFEITNLWEYINKWIKHTI